MSNKRRREWWEAALKFIIPTISRCGGQVRGVQVGCTMLSVPYFWARGFRIWFTEGPMVVVMHKPRRKLKRYQ